VTSPRKQTSSLRSVGCPRCRLRRPSPVVGSGGTLTSSAQSAARDVGFADRPPWSVPVGPSPAPSRCSRRLRSAQATARDVGFADRPPWSAPVRPSPAPLSRSGRQTPSAASRCSVDA